MALAEEEAKGGERCQGRGVAGAKGARKKTCLNRWPYAAVRLLPAVGLQEEEAAAAASAAAARLMRLTRQGLRVFTRQHHRLREEEEALQGNQGRREECQKTSGKEEVMDTWEGDSHLVGRGGLGSH